MPVAASEDGSGACARPIHYMHKTRMKALKRDFKYQRAKKEETQKWKERDGKRKRSRTVTSAPQWCLAAQPAAGGRKRQVSLWKTPSCFSLTVAILTFKLLFQLQFLPMASATERTQQAPKFIFSLKDKPNSCGDSRHPDYFNLLLTNILFSQNTQDAKSY